MILHGIIDRIDFLDEETAAIYDYKTGAVPAKKELIAGEKLQLPLYLWAVQQLYPQLKNVICRYYEVNPIKKIARISDYCYRCGEWPEALGKQSKGDGDVLADEGFGNEDEKFSLAEMIAQILQPAKDGRMFPQIFEQNKEEKSCKYCPYKWVCRVNDWLKFLEKQKISVDDAASS